ncbi:MAG: GlxA family transcriptional regulator [Alphaproteobacteria bacterium]
MTSLSAKPSPNKPNPKLVLFIVYPNIVLLDLVGPLQVFSHAMHPESASNGYVCAVASSSGFQINTNTVVSIPSQPLEHFEDQDIHTLVIVGGDGADIAMLDLNFLETIKRFSKRSFRICSVCSGALILAAAGILDNRRAVTHWSDCKKLEDEFPSVTVDPDPIYIKDGNVWTSAGITAGIDMALAIVAEDLGRPASLEVARSMVTSMARSGGQSQFSPILNRQILNAKGRFEPLHDWIAQNLQEDLGVETLAEKMNMSPRTFHRAYSKEIGTTPAKTVEAMRTEAARSLIEATNFSMKKIANDCGFNDEERMRRAFTRLLKVSPSAYRDSFNQT